MSELSQSDLYDLRQYLERQISNERDARQSAARELREILDEMCERLSRLEVSVFTAGNKPAE